MFYVKPYHIIGTLCMTCKYLSESLRCSVSVSQCLRVSVSLSPCVSVSPSLCLVSELFPLSVGVLVCWYQGTLLYSLFGILNID